MTTDATMLLRLWDESWDAGIWIPSWSSATADLSPEQAAWKPAPQRHSIWQVVHHICIWREYSLTKIDGRPGPAPADVEARNFEESPVSPTAQAWNDTRARLKRTHDDLRALIAASSASPHERLHYHLPHDAYHLGQIMQSRAMQGMKFIY